MTPHASPEEQLRAENTELRARVAEAEETLRAIRSGEVEALVVETAVSPQVFSLDTAGAASNRLRGDILAQVSDAVGMIDNDERIIFLNPAFERLYRVQASEMLGRKLSELYQRRWLKPGDEEVGNATLREQGEAKWELIHITRDGRELHVQSSICLMHDATGNVTGIIAAIRDISERKAAEEKLRAREASLRLSEERLNRLHHVISDPKSGDAERLQRLLRRGIEEFGLERGVIAEIADGRYRVALADTPDASVPVGFSCDAEETICAETLRRNDLLAIKSLAQTDWSTHRAHSEFGTEIYFGVPLQVGGKVFGTLCYTSRVARVDEFSTGDHEFLRLLAQTTGAELTRQQNAAKLSAAEERLRLAVQAGGLGIWETEIESGQRLWSPEAMAIFGLDLADGIGRFGGDDDELLSRVHQDDRHLHDRYRLDLSEAGSIKAEYRIVLPDGDVRWIAGGAMILTRDPAGDPVRSVHIAADITARKQAEAQLREREHFLQRLTDVSPSIIVVFDLVEQRCVFISRSVASLLGYSPEEVIAMGGNVVPMLVHPDDLARFPAHLERVRALRDDEVADFEHRLRDHAGEWHWFHNLDAVFARDAAGAVCQLIGTAIEITARKETEAQLRASDERLRRVHRQSPAGIVETDVTGRMTMVNARWCEMLGYTEDELLQMTVIDVTDEGSRAPTLEAAGRLAAGGPDFQLEKNYRRKDGTALSAHSSVSALRTPDGKFNGLIAVVTDVTARIQAEAELRESHQLTRRVLDTLFVFVGVMTVDGTLIEVNRAPLEVAGISSSEVLGKKFWDCHWVSYSPEVQARVRTACERAAAGEVVRFDVPGRMTGDEMIWIDFQLAPLRDTEGRITHLIPSATDITERRRSEEALRQNTDLFVRLVEQAPTGMCVIDADFRMQQVNALAAPVFATVDPIIGRDYAEVMEILWGPALGAEVARIFRHTLDTGEHYVSPGFTAQRQDINEEQSYEWEIQRVSLADGRYGVACYFHDVTARHRGEQALRESAERLALGTEVAELGLADVDYTTGLNHLTAQAARLFGLGDAAVALPRDKVHATFHPEDREELERRIAQCLDPAGRGWFAMEHRVVWPGGDVRWLSVRKQVFFIGEGAARRPARAMLAALDVTAERTATEAVRESDERMRLATESAAFGMWDWDLSTNAVTWSPQCYVVHGLQVGEFDGTAAGFDRLLHPDDRDRVWASMRTAVDHRAKYDCEFRILRPDGEVRCVTNEGRAVYDEQGRSRRMLGTIIDVTDRRAAAAQLQQLAADLSEADRRKDEFLATLAHELRNPLAPIRNALELMKLAGGQAATVERARSMMERQLTQMVRLVDDLMDVSRISQGKLELRKERVPLAAVLNSAVETSRPLIEQSGHELTVTLPKQPLIVEADMTRLAQVFLNLLNNAAKYGERGGQIQLTVERQGSDAVVTVKDTGIGIAADQLPRIFEMFTQVDRSMEKSQGGLGIGLTLVKRLVEMHGGTVDARSEGPGKGSEFVVRLPIVLETSLPQASAVEDEPAASTSSLRILIVDDNGDGADSLGMMLRVVGYDTRTAYDGQEGVDVAGEFRPDVVLLDIGLPKLNGYEACRRIRDEPWGKDVVLIALTGWGQDEDRRRSHDAGFDHHLVKPVEPQALMKMLAGLQLPRRESEVSPATLPDCTG